MPGLLSRSCPAVLLMCVAGLLSGCSEPKVVPSSGPRAPTTLSQVKIYQKAPARYEILGTVKATQAEGARFDERGNADAGYNTLLTKASALGANGLLLTAAEGEFDRRATAGYRGTFYQVPVMGKPPVAVAQAIYVLKE